jgi:hypothetical protein
MIIKFLGIIDLLAALFLAVSDVPIIGKIKWVIVFILVLKGFPSLLG